MKKIIWMAILIVLSIVEVEASDTYYTKYSNYSEFQEEKIMSSDLINVEKETRYLWYKENKVIGEPKLYNDREEFSNDCYTVVNPVWKQGKPPELDGTTYETRIRYDYVMQKEARYVHLYNLLGNGNFNLTELHIYINNEESDYTYECIGCLDNEREYIKNGIYDDNNYIENGGQIVIDLGKIYPLDQIKIEFYIFDQGKNDKIYTIGFSKDKNILFNATHVLETSDYDWSIPQKFSIDIYSSLIPKEEWTYEQTVYNFMLNDLVLSFNQSLEYRYSQKLCKVYKTVKEYNNEYTLHAIGDYVNKDEEESKTFYRYQIRDKIELDIKEIDNINFDLNDFVKYSSSEYEITHNINWTKNGSYQVTFVIGNLKITKDVILNLKDITIDELKNVIDKLNIEIETNKLNSYNEIILYQNKIENLENIIANLNKKSNQLINEKNYCEEEIRRLELSSLQLGQEINSNYIPQISLLKNLNIFYENKVKELEEDIGILNKSIKQTIIEKDNEIKKLEEELTNIQNVKNNYQKLQNEVEIKEKNHNEINSKYNYVLKINQQNKLLIFWTILLISVALLLYLISCLRKKSNKKKV